MNGDVQQSTIHERVVAGKRLGRHIVHDPRSRDYPAVVADEIDAPRKLVWFWNSWGAVFGVGGRFCMSFDTWQQLLAQTGDVTVPLP